MRNNVQGVQAKRSASQSSAKQTETDLCDTSDSESDGELEKLVNLTADKMKASLLTKTRQNVSSRKQENRDDQSKPVHMNRLDKGLNLASSLQSNLSEKSLYVNVDPIINRAVKKTQQDAAVSYEVEKVLEKSVLKSNLEKKDSLPPYEESQRQLKRQSKRDREKTAGKKWFHLPATEMTDEKKKDLEVLQMRKVLDPKRFYKGNDRRALPKYFMMGRIVDNPADFYHARVPKKQRKATIVDELLADDQFRRYNKKKYTEIQERNMKSGQGVRKHAKRLKKKKR